MSVLLEQDIKTVLIQRRGAIFHVTGLSHEGIPVQKFKARNISLNLSGDTTAVFGIPYVNVHVTAEKGKRLMLDWNPETKEVKVDDETI